MKYLVEDNVELMDYGPTPTCPDYSPDLCPSKRGGGPCHRLATIESYPEPIVEPKIK